MATLEGWPEGVSVGRVKDTSLAERDRRICLYRRNGFTLTEIATMEGISRPRVSQIIAGAHAELPEEETRAEIASLLEFAERKVVELINDPGHMLGPNGRVATDEDGEPVVNRQLVNESVKTLVLIAEKRSRLFAADRPAKPQTPPDLAQQQAAADIARRHAEHDRQVAEDARRSRELEAQGRQIEQQRRELERIARVTGATVPGEVIREIGPPAGA